MSSEQQLIEYNRRLKRSIIKQKETISNQDETIKSLKLYLTAYIEKDSTIKVPWYKRLFK